MSVDLSTVGHSYLNKQQAARILCRHADHPSTERGSTWLPIIKYFSSTQMISRRQTRWSDLRPVSTGNFARFHDVVSGTAALVDISVPILDASSLVEDIKTGLSVDPWQNGMWTLPQGKSLPGPPSLSPGSTVNGPLCIRPNLLTRTRELARPPP